MPDKSLTEAAWQAAAKGKGYKDAALLKALAGLDKAEKAGPAKWLAALGDVDQQCEALRKAHRADRDLAACLDAMAKAALKDRKAAEAARDAADAAGDDEADSPALLTTKMVPLLRQVAKGEMVLQALIASTGKETAVLLSKRSISPSRGKLLKEHLGVTGAVRLIKGECLFEANAHTFVVQTQAAGLAKQLKAALLAQTTLRLKVRVRGEDPDDIDDDGEDASAGETVSGPDGGATRPGADAAADASADAPADAAKAFTARLAGLMPAIKQALSAAAGAEATRLQQTVKQAGDAARGRDFARANRLLDLLAGALTETTAPPAAVESGNPPVEPQKAFSARLAALQSRLRDLMAGAQAAAARPRIAEMTALAKQGEYDAANGLLDELEALMTTAPDSPPRREPDRLDGFESVLARLPGLAARDALLQLDWLDRDLAKAAIDMTAGDAPQRIAHLQQRARQARADLPARLQAQSRQQVADALAAIEKAKVLTGAALLKEVGRLERAMAALADDWQAIGESADGVTAGVNGGLLELRAAYEQGFPQRTPGAKATVVDVKEGDAPKLTLDPSAMRTFFAEVTGDNWFTLKKLFKDGTVGLPRMEQAWAWRQSIVDDYVSRVLEGTYKLKRGPGWSAVGSVTMESDIDLTILDHFREGGLPDGKIVKTDADIVKEFNDWFLAKFGAQPGVMFDVNLYASAKPRRKLPDLETASDVQKAMVSMTNAGQDVGALMKMRRYMDWNDYQKYQDTVVGEMRADGADPADIETTIKQFEEADSLFQLSLSNTLSKTVELIKVHEPKTPEQQKALAMLEQALADAAKLGGTDGVKAQQILIDAAKELEHHMADTNMWVNNELYTQGIAEVRELEERADALQAEIDDSKPPLGPDSGPARQLAGVMARLKTLHTDSVFFANEAYHSQGPFVHIVEATQGVKSDLERSLARAPTPKEIEEESQRRREGLSMHLLLQSFNEQLGDLLKDLAHYAGEDNPGIGLYRSSKYLQRLLDALALLNGKIPGLGLAFDPAKKSADVAGTLLAARKGKVKFDAMEEAGADAVEREVQAYAIEQMDALFQVKTLGAVADKFKAIGASVNAKARKQLANEMRAAKEQESAYFS